MVNGAIEIVDGLVVTALYRVDEAVLDMILQNRAACAAQRGLDRGELDQNVGAVPLLLHHLPNGLQMADGTGKPVYHRFGLGMSVFRYVDFLPSRVTAAP